MKGTIKKSIRGRFTLIFISLTAAILIGIWCVNNWLLESFYVDSKVSALQTAYDQLNRFVVECAEAGRSISDEFEFSTALDSGEQTEPVRLLRTLDDKHGIMTVLVDGINDRVIVSSSRDANFMIGKARQYILGMNVPRAEIIQNHDNYTIQKTYDVLSRTFYLESWGYFSDNKTIFIMSTPLESIQESVALSNRFLAYVGLAALALSSVIVYFITKTVTLPILKLAGISERMSRLDFDAKYEGNMQDEIGILGNSMNILSDKLKETIGELKTANNELQKDIEEKIQVDEMRKDFIANVSHELKTPIALIQGYAEGLAEGMAQDPENREYYCNVIVDEANKMNRMVCQLLTLTDLEFGHEQIALERFDLVELIRGVLSSAAILIRQKEAKVLFETEEPVYVWADEFKIEEVVTNYISNALNHLDGERMIRITIEEMGDAVRVTVGNTGAKIAEHDLPNIWTKFYKADKARTREYGGSGIGLSIVKAIMDSHHKAYGVRNVEDGVEFWFELDSKDNA